LHVYFYKCHYVPCVGHQYSWDVLSHIHLLILVNGQWADQISGWSRVTWHTRYKCIIYHLII
jgi:hypothetical protein